MSYLAILSYNLGLAAAIGLTIWITKSPWPLLGFLFAFSWKANPKSGTCPECKKVVVFKRLEKEEDDEA